MLAYTVQRVASASRKFEDYVIIERLSAEPRQQQT